MLITVLVRVLSNKHLQPLGRCWYSMLRAELKVIGGKQHGRLIALASKKFLIGREQDCHLRPNNESISRHHCVLNLDDYGVRIRDLGSTNGTFVNGKRVQGQVPLKAHDRILIGKLEFEVALHETATVTQTAGGPEPIYGGILDDAPDVVPPSTSETMLDLPIPQDLAGDSGETAVLSGDTTIIPNAAPLDPATSEPQQAEPQPEEQPAAVSLQPPVQQVPIPASQSPVQPPMAQPAAPVPQPAGQTAPPPPPLEQQVPQQPLPQQPMPAQPVAQPGMPAQPYVQQQPMTPDYMQQQQMLQQQMLQQQMLQQQYYQQQMQQPSTLETGGTDEESDIPPTQLPDPSETGAQPPEPPKAEEQSGESAESESADANQTSTNPAADIIRQYMNRRTT